MESLLLTTMTVIVGITANPLQVGYKLHRRAYIASPTKEQEQILSAS